MFFSLIGRMSPIGVWALKGRRRRAVLLCICDTLEQAMRMARIARNVSARARRRVWIAPLS